MEEGWYDVPIALPKSGLNILGVVTFSLFFGALLNQLGPEVEVLVKFFRAMEMVTMKMVKMVIWFVILAQLTHNHGIVNPQLP